MLVVKNDALTDAGEIFSEQTSEDKTTKDIVNGQKKWYVVQVYSGYEKRVKSSLEERIKIDQLENFFGRILVPTEEVVEIKSGQKRKSERKFFPGYVLIQMEMNKKTWQLVRRTPRVSRFVGGETEHPTPISREEVKKILGSLDAEINRTVLKPRTTFEVGQIVRVLEGPFSDFTGSIQDINYEKSRLHVAVSIFSRSTPVELEFSQVEKDL